MRISGINNFNFKALIGKKEVTYNHGDTPAHSSVRVVLHIYPFKDEFVKGDEKSAIVDYLCDFNRYEKEIRNSSVDNAHNHSLKVVVEEPLPFNEYEYTKAKNNPHDPDVSKEALDFIASDKNGTTIYKHSGLFHSHMISVSNGKVSETFR